jgi:hypothetical protein
MLVPRLVLRRWSRRGSSHHMRNNGLITSRPAVAVWNTVRLQANGNKSMERTSLVEAWENEKSAYHGEAVDSSTFQSYGHYTQLVWRNTKSVGCSKAECGVRSLDTLRRPTQRSLQRRRPCPILINHQWCEPERAVLSRDGRQKRPGSEVLWPFPLSVRTFWGQRRQAHAFICSSG